MGQNLRQNNIVHQSTGELGYWVNNLTMTTIFLKHCETIFMYTQVIQI